MKAKYLFIGLLFTVAGFSSCKKDKFKDALYITGTEVNPAVTLSVDNGTLASIAVSVTASGQVSQAISASLRTAPDLVEQYNKTYGKHYLAVPEGSYALSSAEVSIKAGSNVSNAITFSVTSVKDFKEGSAYMMPVTISTNTGDLNVLESSRTIYIIVKPVIRATVASLVGNYFKADFSVNNASLKSMSVVSMEARVLVNSFQSSNPFISSVMGIEENFLLRFGDVTIKPNQLQLAGGGTPLTVPNEFGVNTWYHLALVFDGSSIKIYVNGVQSASLNASRKVDLTNGDFFIGRSANGRLLNGLISECRIWSKALSQTEILNGMCGIDPKSAGLEAYWKFNEGTGKVATDLSGHGRNATASSTVTWVPNVKCE
ncbi:DUF1735 and LamG domain-containing protein [Pedobacter nutrimenti]|uniref:Uncharacterized protein DUF1735 n=1 Tax=Pedobacter nutrimenti TaxID=1241337 RepID=A0A318UNF5_9SPHI|nr:DUF1735 and LamG domain-containing protein [Pedobacter nutrimenti]PYF76987.1 uncharacterized protein DUF1735 [Pedobacter nutrimenti]